MARVMVAGDPVFELRGVVGDREVAVGSLPHAALTPWQRPRAVHDSCVILLDVALAVALGGDCLADAGLLRSELAVFGPVAST